MLELFHSKCDTFPTGSTRRYQEVGALKVKTQHQREALPLRPNA